MSTRSPILEYSDNNPIPTYTAPVEIPPVTATILNEAGVVICNELSSDIEDDALSPTQAEAMIL